MILHIFMYNVISDFSAATPASEGRVKYIFFKKRLFFSTRLGRFMLFYFILIANYPSFSAQLSISVDWYKSSFRHFTPDGAKQNGYQQESTKNFSSCFL